MQCGSRARGHGSADTEVDVRRYRRWRDRRRNAQLNWQGQQQHPNRDAEDLLRFALTWAPFGGASDEEMFVRFGMSYLRFTAKLWQIVDEVGCDTAIIRELADVYPLQRR
ncbi:hypothetical protein EEB14_51100 [Rhodococcus sp. WS4]|nr:hypothetical protein EEB14_51100 [Rhodococcus sp. WS4]